MMKLEQIKPGVVIELLDHATEQWLQLTITKVASAGALGGVECRTLADEPILTTVGALIENARLRSRDGTCRDCGYEAHDGPCVERLCAECGAEVSSRCAQHPQRPVHVYRRVRYLAEIDEDKPYPTRESSLALEKDLVAQMQTLRNAEQPRQSRVMITVVERAEILSAIENAIALISSLPGSKRRTR
jgi:hypothetical protein